MKTVLVTGSQGFIGSYICNDLLERGYLVVGIDNFSKYGKVTRAHDTHENFTLIRADVTDLMSESMISRLDEYAFDYIIAGAAMIGGISYFHKYAYDLMAENERIMASTFDFAIREHKLDSLKRIMVISSSMVFERTENYPTPESEIDNVPVPLSTYGFQPYPNNTPYLSSNHLF